MIGENGLQESEDDNRYHKADRQLLVTDDEDHIQFFFDDAEQEIRSLTHWLTIIFPHY